MKKLAFVGAMNGWRDAPHCWRNFVYKQPIRVEKPSEEYPVLKVSVFGFVFFFEVGGNG